MAYSCWPVQAESLDFTEEAYPMSAQQASPGELTGTASLTMCLLNMSSHELSLPTAFAAGLQPLSPARAEEEPPAADLGLGHSILEAAEEAAEDAIEEMVEEPPAAPPTPAAPAMAAAPVMAAAPTTTAPKRALEVSTVQNQIPSTSDSSRRKEKQQASKSRRIVAPQEEEFPESVHSEADQVDFDFAAGGDLHAEEEQPEEVEEEEEEEVEEEEEPAVRIFQMHHVITPPSEPTGTRWSKRQRFAPLDYWKNEKPIYRSALSLQEHHLPCRSSLPPLFYLHVSSFTY